MKKIRLETSCRKMLADVYTPVGIYLRLRDKFRDTILLESTDHHAADNSWSFIGINAIAGIEVKDLKQIELKFPGQLPEKKAIADKLSVPLEISNYLQQYEVVGDCEIKAAQSFFGYTSFDAVQFFDSINLATPHHMPSTGFPLIRYRLYQYVIAINHFKDELFLCENKVAGVCNVVACVG